VHIVGDLMADHAQAIAAALPPNPAVLERFGLQRRAYAVTTVHRPSNTDDEAAFARILEGLRAIEIPVVFPVHPRTQALARKHRVGDADNLLACEPLPYAEMVALVANAAMVFTDSGGLQKETFILRVPCTTLREETEWLDTLVNGWNVLAGSDARKIVEAWQRPAPGVQAPTIDDGFTTRRIVDALIEHRAMRAA
jgi:UDP-N-acetylglucosamine 2-epimerase